MKFKGDKTDKIEHAKIKYFLLAAAVRVAITERNGLVPPQPETINNQ